MTQLVMLCHSQNYPAIVLPKAEFCNSLDSHFILVKVEPNQVKNSYTGDIFQPIRSFPK